MTRLIALTGLAGSGKSTVAKHLTANHGYRVEKFAGPLKDMLRGFGLTERHIEGDLKEVPCDLLGGKTPRHAMQTLGTEWGRNLISPTLWVGAWSSRAATGSVVCDDCRFPNEAAAVRALDGIVVRVVRPGLACTGGHASEAHQDGIKPDAVLWNDETDDGSLGQLYSRVDALIRQRR
jgi:hypothetical protein